MATKKLVSAQNTITGDFVEVSEFVLTHEVYGQFLRRVENGEVVPCGCPGTEPIIEPAMIADTAIEPDVDTETETETDVVEEEEN